MFKCIEDIRFTAESPYLLLGRIMLDRQLLEAQYMAAVMFTELHEFPLLRWRERLYLIDCGCTGFDTMYGLLRWCDCSYCSDAAL